MRSSALDATIAVRGTTNCSRDGSLASLDRRWPHDACRKLSRYFSQSGSLQTWPRPRTTTTYEDYDATIRGCRRSQLDLVRTWKMSILATSYCFSENLPSGRQNSGVYGANVDQGITRPEDSIDMSTRLDRMNARLMTWEFGDFIQLLCVCEN